MAGNFFDDFDGEPTPPIPAANYFDEFDEPEAAPVAAPRRGPGNWEAGRPVAREGDAPLVVAGQNALEIVKGMPAGAVSGVGSAVQGLAAPLQGDNIDDEAYFYLRMAAAGQLNPDGIVAARKEAMARLTPAGSFAFQSAMSEIEEARESGADPAEILKDFKPTPIGEKSLYKTGEEISKFARTVMPAAPGYEDSIGRQIGEGLGSMAPGTAATLIAGPAGGAVVFGAQGSGEATERAVKAGASDDQTRSASALGAAVGTTNVLPIETLIGRLPLPFKASIERMVTKFGAGEVSKAAARVGEQALIEGMQEGGETFLQNLIAQEVYKPEQSLTEGVLPDAGVGAGVGGVAAGAIEAGKLALESFAGRRGRGHAARAPEAASAAEPAVTITPPTLDDIASPIDTDLIQRGKQAVADAQAGIKPTATAPPVAAEAAPVEIPPVETVTTEPGAEAPTGRWVPLHNDAGAAIGEYNEVTGQVRRDPPVEAAQAAPPGAVTAPSDAMTAGSETATQQPPTADIPQIVETGGEFAATKAPPTVGDGSRTSPVRIQTAADIEAAGASASEPTAAQAEAGNHRMGHAKLDGMDISIEIPKGGMRRGTRPDGSTWETELPAAYGYVKKATGADGENFDVYLGANPESKRAFVVDQIDPKTGKFDEHKAMLAFDTEAEAVAAYDGAFSDGSGPSRRGAVTEMPVDEFREFVKSSAVDQPVAYKPGAAPAAEPAAAEPADPNPHQVELPTKNKASSLPDAGVYPNQDASGKWHARYSYNAGTSGIGASTRNEGYDSMEEARRAALQDIADRTSTTAYGGPTPAEKRIATWAKVQLGAKAQPVETVKPAPGISPEAVAAADARRSASDNHPARGIEAETVSSLPDTRKGRAHPAASLNVTKGRDGKWYPGYKYDTAESGGSGGGASTTDGYATRAEAVADAARGLMRMTDPAGNGRRSTSSPKSEHDAVSRIYQWAKGLAGRDPTTKIPTLGADAPSKKFNPAEHVSAAKAYVATGKSLKGAAKALGLTDAETARVMNALAGQERSGIRIDKKGQARRIAKRTGPVDVVTFLAELGGIRDDEGHDLRKGRGLQRPVPGVGPLIRPKGMSIDAAGEALHEAGYFQERPTEDEVLQMLERTAGGAKVYRPEEGAEVSAAAQARTDEATEAERRADIQAVAKSMGEPLSAAEISEILDAMAANPNVDAEEAVVDYIEALAMRTANEGEAETGDAGYDDQHIFDDIPFDESAYDAGQDEPREDHRDDGPPEGGRASEAGDEAEGGESGPAAEEGARPSVARTETVDTVDGKREQGRLFDGAEDRATPPKITRSGQRPADEGLFGGPDEAEPETASMFDKPRQTETKPFKHWFAGSKAVNDEGAPLRLYHGTSKSEGGQAISIFNTYGSNYGLFGQGQYFTDDPAVASSYTKKGRGDEPTVYPVYLSVKNPIDMDAKADRAAWEKGFPYHADFDAYPPEGETNEAYYRSVEEALSDEGLPEWEGAEVMQGGLMQMGHDGITHIGGGRVKSEGVRHKVFIAFHPEQIKSATGNSGAFDPNDGRIAYRAGTGAEAQLTDTFTGKADAVYADLRAELDGVGLTGVDLRVENSIFATSGGGISFSAQPGSEQVNGFFWRNTIGVALDSQNGVDFTLNHEIIHGLASPRLFDGEHGLFRSAEWSTMERAVRADSARMANIARRYPGLTAAERIEEGIADMYADWKAGRYEAKGLIATAFKRIAALLEALGNALRGNGFMTAADVFADISSGKVGARGPAEPEPAAGDDRIAFSRGDENSMFRANYGAPRRTVAEDLFADSRTFLGGLRNLRPGSWGESFNVWRYAFQDRFIDLKDVQGQIARILGRDLAATENAYRAEELMSGKIGARLERLSEEMVAPLVQGITERLNGATVRIAGHNQSGLDLLETFLYARHAPERNARIAAINPHFAEGEGSGMTDAEAAAIMRAVEDSGHMDALKSVARQVDAMIDFSLQARLEAGLLSEGAANAWRNGYKFYVPLRGFAEMDPETEGERPSLGGTGINVKGAESRRAFGRTSRADNIVAHVISQAQEAIVRAERNEVGQALFTLVSQAPNPDFWQADKVDMRPTWNESTQQVEYRPVTPIFGSDADYTVTMKFEGKEHRVTFNRENSKAMRLADSMRNLSGQDFAWMVRNLGSVNRWLSAVNTSYNPEFVITNAFRDLQAGLINLSQYDMPGLVRGTWKDYKAALYASSKGAFKATGGARQRALEARIGYDHDAWQGWFDEFNESGARVRFNQIESVDDLKRKLEDDLRAATSGPSVMKAWHKIAEFVERANQSVESAIRLSAYKNARERGMSKSDAASLAKNLTVNFNRRGKFGPVMNTAYLFYNASVQGTATMLAAMRSPRVRKILGAAASMGAALTVYNMMAGGDDDDGEPFYDKISDFDKERNLIIMSPDGSGGYFKIPLPYGYNVFPGLGRSAVEMAWGKDPAKVMGSVVVMIVDAFNPVGGSESLLKFIAPTVVDPFVDVTTNEDYSGRPIAPEQSPYQAPKPDAQMYWNSVSPGARGITDTLTTITGGDDVTPGLIDVSPETLDHLFGTVTGAAGTFWSDRVAGTLIKLGDPQSDMTLNDVPFVRKLIGSPPAWYDKSAFYERSKEIDALIERAKTYTETGRPEKAAEIRAEHGPLMGLNKMSDATRKTLGAIRKANARNILLRDDGKITAEEFNARAATNKAREQGEIQRFNAAYIRAKARQE